MFDFEKLAKAIEVQPHTSPEALSGFHMNSYFHDCGTPSCIEGWAAQQLRDEGIPVKLVGSGVADSTIRERITQNFAYWKALTLPSSVDYDSITPEMAARAVRLFAEDKFVDWLALGAEKA